MKDGERLQWSGLRIKMSSNKKLVARTPLDGGHCK